MWRVVKNDSGHHLRDELNVAWRVDTTGEVLTGLVLA